MNVVQEVKWLRRRACLSVSCSTCNVGEGQRCVSATGVAYPPAWHHKARFKKLDKVMKREA